MQLYADQGFDEFFVALGYKGESIKDYFLNQRLLSGDLHIDLGAGHVDCIQARTPGWRVNLCDTGHDTLTGGRLQRLAPRLNEDGTFMLTYGDGLADVDLRALLAFHREHGRIATVTAVRPPQRNRFLDCDGATMLGFSEPVCSDWINGGFFVFEPEVFDYLSGDSTVLEADALVRLAEDDELMAFQHEGFWQCMDTVQERDYLEELWRSGDAPWARRSRATKAAPRQIASSMRGL
jgi:glucose-1-phosphate cytidylyltransferase